MARLVLSVLLVAGCTATSDPVSAPGGQPTVSNLRRAPGGKAEHPLRYPAFNPFGAVKRSLRRPARRADRDEQRTPLATLFQRLALCESGGDWHINTGNGYYGGLQEALEFWASFGGLRFAARPDLATEAEQVAVAERGLAAQGWGAWPVCSVRSGVAR